jgi:hypothetical protein
MEKTFKLGTCGENRIKGAIIFLWAEHDDRMPCIGNALETT